jgi:hypothetical protein
VRLKQQSGVAQPQPLAAKQHGPDQNLPVLLRSDAPSHSAFAHQIASVRLSFPRRPGGITGKDFKTSRLPSRSANGHYETTTKLDHLFAAEKTLTGTGRESEMPAGLRAVGFKFQIRFEEVGKTSREVPRARWGLCGFTPRPKEKVNVAERHRHDVIIFWALVRGILGMAQMTGAIVSLILLLRLGPARQTMTAVSLTMIFTLVSIALFRWLRVQDKGRP